MNASRLQKLVVAVSAACFTARAAAQVEVSAFVRTDTAVYFQPSAQPNVVWYVPFVETRVFPVDPPYPGVNYWRAAVVMKPGATASPGDLRPDWAGKAIVPYVLRPASECVFNKLLETRFVQQEVRASGRDVSAASAAPVCQFSFRVPATVPPALFERAAAGTLIAYRLALALEHAPRVAWARVYAAVLATLGEAAGAPMALSEARDVVRRALAGDDLTALGGEMTAPEAEDFLDAVVAGLFIPAAPVEEGDPGDRVQLAPGSPEGALVYHRELVDIAL